MVTTRRGHLPVVVESDRTYVVVTYSRRNRCRHTALLHYSSHAHRRTALFDFFLRQLKTPRQTQLANTIWLASLWGVKVDWTGLTASSVQTWCGKVISDRQLSLCRKMCQSWERWYLSLIFLYIEHEVRIRSTVSGRLQWSLTAVVTFAVVLCSVENELEKRDQLKSV